MKRNATLVLFQNKIYSTDPELPEDQFMGPDVLYYRMFADTNDKEILHVIQPSDMYQPKSVTEKLLLPDEVLTEVRDQVRNTGPYKKETSPVRDYEFTCARKVIVDDHYPVFVKFTRKFKRWTGKRRTEAMLGAYHIEMGRVLLVEMFQQTKYEPALPELREIILHDRSTRMIRAGAWALRDIGTRKSAVIINELLLQKDLPFWKQMLLVSASKQQNDPVLTIGLKSVFQNTYLYYPSDWGVVYCEATIQQEILKTCSTIPTLQALEILELGIAHPYEHVERAAWHGIQKWTKLMLQRIQNGNDEGHGLLIAKIIKKYDLAIFGKSYSHLHKQSTSIKF